MKPDKGKVLISEPFLPDPNFSRTVILLTEYSEEGAVGYVLNNQTEYTVGGLMEELEYIKSAVYQGGPVELESFHYLHKYPEITGCAKITDTVYWSGDFMEVQEGLKSGKFEQNNFKFFVGYSGWSKGQLEAELKEKTWLISELRDEMVFDSQVSDKELWKHAIRHLDGDDSLMANSPSDPYLN
jgi:putative transcriptional regulator